MKRFMLLIVPVAVLFFEQAFGLQSSYQIPLTLTNGIYSTVLRLGVNPGNTIGVDTSSALGTFREIPAPPAPPQPYPWDTRFVTIPGRISTFPIGLSGGVLNDYRGYIGIAQIDSFKIIIQGDETDNAATTVSWPSNLADFGTSWTIKPQAGSDWPATNMLTSSSVQIDAGLHKNIIIIKIGAISLPVQLASFSGSRFGDDVVRLNWMTISEVNNYGFFIERRTATDSVFVEVTNSFVPGHGTTNEPWHYSFADVNTPASSLFYRLKQIDLDGSVHVSEPIQIDNTTDVKENTPHAFALSQNYPNPFNPSTEILYSLPMAGQTSLVVYSILGTEVATLVNEVKSAGSYRVTFNAVGLPSGTYFFRLQSAGHSVVKIMTLVK